VVAIGQPRSREARRTAVPSAAVDPAFEARARLGGGELPGRGVVVGRARGAAGDVGVRRRGVNRDRAGRRGAVGVAGLVDGANVEGVVAVGQRRGREGRGAAVPAAAVDPAFEGGAALGGGEGPGRGVVVGRA